MHPYEVFGTELALLSRRWRTRLDERLRHTGLTQARWTTLLLLSRGGTLVTQRELAAQAGIEGPTLVRLLDALESQGLIERRPVDGDRRAKHVCLTAAGKAVLEDINRIVSEVRRETLAGVDAKDLATCLKVFRQARARLEAPA